MILNHILYEGKRISVCLIQIKMSGTTKKVNSRSVCDSLYFEGAGFKLAVLVPPKETETSIPDGRSASSR